MVFLELKVVWQEAWMLAREDDWGKRRVIESLEIQQRRPMMSLDAGLILDPLWTPFLCSSRSHVTESAVAGCQNPIYGGQLSDDDPQS